MTICTLKIVAAIYPMGGRTLEISRASEMQAKGKKRYLLANTAEYAVKEVKYDSKRTPKADRGL